MDGGFGLCFCLVLVFLPFSLFGPILCRFFGPLGSSGERKKTFLYVKKKGEEKEGETAYSE